MHIINRYFIGTLLDTTTDPTERARATLSYWFTFIYLITVFLSFPTTVIFKNYDVMAFLGVLLIINIAALFSFRFTHSYKLSTLLQTFVVLAHAIGNSMLTSYSLSIVLFIWPLIFTFILNFILGNIATLWYISIFSLLVTGISFVRIFEIFPVNQIHEVRLTYITGFILLVASIFIYLFIKIYDRTRNEALTNQLASREHQDNILHMVAHDLRNTIGAGMGAEELLKFALDDGDLNSARRYLGLIEQSIDNSATIVNDLLESAAIPTARSNLSLAPSDIALMTCQLIDRFKPVAQNKKIDLDVDKLPGDFVATIDRDKMERVISNLLSNSIKFTPSGGKISAHLAAKPGHVILTIKDTGIGIPKALQKELFKKFTSAGRRGTNGERSVGLGMYIVKSILDLHHAGISLLSEEHKGTEFTIEIPRTMPA